MSQHIEKSALIPVPPDRVFSLLAQREKAAALVPNLTRVWDIKPAQPGVGQSWKWEYRLLGMPIQGDAHMTAFEPNKSYQFKTSGKVESTWTYRVAPDAAGSKVTVGVDYSLPDTFLAKLADKVAFHRINESQVEHILVNLRAQLA